MYRNASHPAMKGSMFSAGGCRCKEFGVVTSPLLQNSSLICRVVSNSCYDDRGFSVIMGPCSNLSVTFFVTLPAQQPFDTTLILEGCLPRVLI